jgi:virulence-associated protein VapD
MIVGMREITEENCSKFLERVSFVEKTQGSFFYKNKKPLYISEKDINRMIGLKTNASLLTKAQFIKRHTQDLKI